MTLDQATKKIAGMGYSGRAANAAALVLSSQASIGAAAKQEGVDRAAVTRLLNKVSPLKACPCCGHTRRDYAAD